ncbi:MAG: polyribonucleotide nucleotidyltransferase, partial [Rhodospirillales bacterium]|nr:polyribonucleotide nucleotidyltransferase [Rhodospirillales bacterium]
MFREFRKEIEWGGKPLILETGKVARQADGCVIVTYGESTVLCAVVGERQPKPGLDFFPLTVHYVEKAYAAGKIPGGFFKREGRPTEKETLVSRLIDRPIRPLFVKGFKNETQVIAQVLSHDQENETDVPAMIAASAALTISGLPFMGPIGACRVGYKDGEYLLNPTLEEMAESELELMLAGTSEGVLMVESEASELSEEDMLGAVTFGHEAFQPVIQAIIELAEVCAKDPIDLPVPPEGKDALAAKVRELGEGPLRDAYKETIKQVRQEKISAAKADIVAALKADESKDQDLVSAVLGDILKSLESDIVRRDILDTGMRIDGRDTKTVRQIAVEVGVLPRAHGSALFTRGETQALVVTTLGTGQDEQIIDGLA